MARKVFSWALSLPFLIVFIGTLTLFHPFVLLSYYLLGANALAKVLHAMTWCIINSLRIVGTRIEIVREYVPAAGTPIIIISNHQSFFDVPFMYLVLPNHIPKFVTKKELARWIPSVSFNIRRGGSVIIDRGDARDAMAKIADWAPYIAQHAHAAVVFPEGTRSRDGLMRRFKSAGAVTLMNSIPNALVVPVVIEGSWELVRWGLLPLPVGITFRATILEPIERASKNPKQVVDECEKTIRARLGQPEPSPNLKAVAGTKRWI